MWFKHLIQRGVLLLALTSPACAADTSGPAAISGEARLTQQRDAVRQIVEAAAAVEGAPPAFAVVVVTEAGEIIEMRGRRGPDPEGPAIDRHTPFYIASITKSYVGLLASLLDHEGVLSLEATLAELLPDQSWPDDVDPSAITLRAVLGHGAGLNNRALNFRLANIGEVSAETFNRVLTETTEATGPGFRYNNFGYQLYAYILEQRTGRSWKSWLETELLRPAGLLDTSAARTQPPSDYVWGHQLGAEGWVALSPKPTATLHAAGGLYTSPHDAARWLDLNLARSSLDPAVFTTQRETITQTEANMPGRSCSGYALGLMVCEIGSTPVYGHFGTYAGWRSTMSFSPELGAGVYVMTGSDHMAQMWAMIVETRLYALFGGHEDGPPFEQMLAMFAGRAADFGAERAETRAAALARADAFGPVPLESLQAFTGRYVHPAIGGIELSIEGGRLVMTAGAFKAVLLAEDSGVFTAVGEGVTVETILITDGALEWGGDIFVLQR